MLVFFGIDLRASQLSQKSNIDIIFRKTKGCEPVLAFGATHLDATCLLARLIRRGGGDPPDAKWGGLQEMPMRSLLRSLVRLTSAPCLLVLVVSLLLSPASAMAAGVTALINANSGGGTDIVNETLPGPAIERTAFAEVTGTAFDTFSTGTVSADLRDATLKVVTDVERSSFFAASISATASLEDLLTFEIDQAPGEFIEVTVLFQLDGTLFSSEASGGGSQATLNTDLLSFEGAAARDSLISERRYGKLPSVALESVTAADPETFFETTQIGDFVFDNDDFGRVEGTIRLFGPNPTLDIVLSLITLGKTDFFSTATFGFVDLPGDVSFTSESGFFLTGAVIPLPAAAWLFLSGIAALGCARRKG